VIANGTAQLVRAVDSGGVRVRRSLPAGASTCSSTCPGCGIPIVVRLVADAKTSPRVLLDPRKGPAAVYAQALPLGPSGPPAIGGTCPGFTSGLELDGDPDGCDNCYWQALAGRYSGLEALGFSNLRALGHVEECAGARGLAAVFVDVLDHVAQYQRRDGLEVPTIRWNPGGDVRSDVVARAIARAHRERPDVLGWIYTRTLGAVRHLVEGGPGLRVFVSADRVNVDRATRVAARHRVPIALLAADRESAAVLWARVERLDPAGRVPRPIVCPASGKYATDGKGSGHVVAVDGSRRGLEAGTIARGACDACRVCLPDGLERSVTFLRHGGRRDVFAPVRVSIRAARG
jgi:hypothetical protein